MLGMSWLVEYNNLSLYLASGMTFLVLTKQQQLGFLPGAQWITCKSQYLFFSASQIYHFQSLSHAKIFFSPVLIYSTLVIVL